MIASAAFYDPRAEHYGERYASAHFEEVHGALLRHLPASGAHVADIGAGSGRDAFALTERGYHVTAVEPSAGMRDWAISSHPRSTVKWINDALPGLNEVLDTPRRFEFVLCSAVLMHLPPATLSKCFFALSTIATPSGKIAVSVRAPTPADPKRIFHNHSPADLQNAAKAAGLATIDQGQSVDVMGRAVMDWRWMVFQRL